MRMITLLLLGAVACGSSGQTVIGEWRNEGLEGGANTITFRDDGTAEWAFENEMIGSFELTYTVDYGPTPHHIQLTGFEHGLLTGMTLYGILEFAGPDTLRVDFEAGHVDTPADDVRPAEFGPQAQPYTRIRP